MSGAFVAVVGPSGSGKDSILENTRTALKEHGGIVFPQRHITRPAGAGEDHKPVTEEEFHLARRRGEFALTWSAHGLAYGIPAHVFDVVETGGLVVVNVSRQVLKQLPGLFTNVHVARVTVPEAIRHARILARGRETGTEVASRVARPDPAPDHPVDLEIVNDGPLEDAAGALVKFLTRIRDAARA